MDTGESSIPSRGNRNRFKLRATEPERRLALHSPGGNERCKIRERDFSFFLRNFKFYCLLFSHEQINKNLEIL